MKSAFAFAFALLVACGSTHDAPPPAPLRSVPAPVAAPLSDAAIASAPTLVLTVSAAGAMTADDHRGAPLVIPDDQLESVMRIAYERDRDGKVAVVGDPSVPFQRVIAILETAKQAGIDRFAFGTSASALVTLAHNEAKATELPAAAPYLALSFPANGGVLFGAPALADAALDDAFRDAANADRTIAVLADGSRTLGEVTSVLDRAQRAGLTKFVLANARSPLPQPRKR